VRSATLDAVREVFFQFPGVAIVVAVALRAEVLHSFPPMSGKETVPGATLTAQGRLHPLTSTVSNSHLSMDK
jgi:hypothetical protein